jgi:hypothetical protein
VRANATSSAPERRKPADQGPNPRQHKPSTRGSSRGSRGGRGGGRGGNGGGSSRKDSSSASKDTAIPAPKVVVDPPTTTNTPAEPSPTPKPNSRPKPARRHSTTDSASTPSQTNARPQNRRKGSQQSNAPSKLLNAKTLSRKAATGPSSPNPAEELLHFATTTSTTPVTELKSDIDALVERVRAVAMDRPHTPGSHIDWADDDDSLPNLGDWGYPEGVVAPVQPEEPPASIPLTLEDASLQSIVPETKVEGEASPDEPKLQDVKPGPVPNATPRAHKVQKTQPKRGGRSNGNPRTQQLPPALNPTDSVSQVSTLPPTQSTSTTAIPHTAKPRGQKRQNLNQGQNPNQGQNSRNNQGQTNSRINGGGRQRSQNGVAVASPTRNSFPAKTGPKADHTPSAQDRSPDIVPPVTNPPAEPDSKPLKPKEESEKKKGIPTETPRNTDTSNPNENLTATNPTPRDPEPTQNDFQPNKRNPHNTSHVRSHTYGGRTQDSPQPPHSAPILNAPHHPSENNPDSQNRRRSRSPNLPQSSGTRSTDLGPTPRSAGYEGHFRVHSSPSGVGGATRTPHLSRPIIAGEGLSLVRSFLGNSPRKNPPPAS